MKQVVNIVFCILQISIICMIFFFSSCSVSFEKRRYTRGHYIDIQTRYADREITNTNEDNVEIHKLSDNFTASVKEEESQKFTYTVALQVKQHEPCDRIYFDDGTQAEVKVLDINEKEVAYRKCNEPHSPVIILNKKYISKIEFSSGERYEAGVGSKQEQVIQEEEIQTTQEATNQSKEPKQSSAKEGIINILALLFAIVGLVMLILAFIHVWYWLFGAAIFSALGASMGWLGINRSLKGLGIVALIIGTICSVLSSILFGFI